jgi:hypothetical protein
MRTSRSNTSVYQNECPLFGVKRNDFSRRECPLMTQSGHGDSLPVPCEQLREGGIR